MSLLLDVAPAPVRGEGVFFVAVLAAIMLVLFAVATVAALIIFFVRRRRKARRAQTIGSVAVPATNEGV